MNCLRPRRLGAGGVNFCIGSDYYKFNYNWICGNMSSGDGGGIAHLGFSHNGDISNNSILFNQSTNPTVPTSGGGLVVMGPAPDGQTIQNGVPVECGPPLIWLRARVKLTARVPASTPMQRDPWQRGGKWFRRRYSLPGRQRHRGDPLPTTIRKTGIRSTLATTSSSTTWPAGTAPA